MLVKPVQTQKKRNKGLGKSLPKKKAYEKKPLCSVCQMKLDALLRKYSSQNYQYYLRIENHMQKQVLENPQRQQIPRQLMNKYYKPVQRKRQFFEIKQIYSVHKQAPRIFMTEILNILSKRHHRKRLLEYFKLAKALGLKCSNAKTSTFLFSLSATCNPHELKPFERILNSISKYEFSEQIEKRLLQALDGKQSLRELPGLNPELEQVL